MTHGIESNIGIHSSNAILFCVCGAADLNRRNSNTIIMNEISHNVAACILDLMIIWLKNKDWDIVIKITANQYALEVPNLTAKVLH